MSKVKIQGNASGTGVLTVTAPNTDTDRTITLPDTTGTLLDENSSVPAANLTGALPAISGANLTGLASPSITKVTMAYNSDTRTAFSYSRDLFANNLGFVGHKVSIPFTKDSASTDIMIVWSMQVTAMRNCYQTATYSGSSGSASHLKRFAFVGSRTIAENSGDKGMTITGTAIYPSSEINSTGSKTFYWGMGRLNDGYNSSYVLNPNTGDDSEYGGATTSTITVLEGDFT
jgi:hypothetical protein